MKQEGGLVVAYNSIYCSTRDILYIMLINIFMYT